MKKKNFKSLLLKKQSISDLMSLDAVSGGSGVNCVTEVGSCQTTSCVCTQNPLVCKPSWDTKCGSGYIICTNNK